MSNFLEIEDLTVAYDQVMAVKRLHLALDEGETLLLVGPNGSGKSSVLLAVIGVVRPRSGAVRFCGRDITHMKPWDRVRLGIGLLPENRRLFDDLTVQENLELVADVHPRHGRPRIADAYDLFPVLRDRRRCRSVVLSGGERQMLALARLYLRRPILALLDDPLAGLDENVGSQLLSRADFGSRGMLIATPSAEQFVDRADRVERLGMSREMRHGEC